MDKNGSRTFVEGGRKEQKKGIEISVLPYKMG
jgi:hypothetical protein